MPNEVDLERRARRMAWWLMVARRVRGRTQGDVAQALSLKAASSVGDFERGVTQPSLKQLVLLASLYDVPLSTFTDPAMTDEERLLGSAIGAAVLEREDWEAEQDPDQDAADGPSGGRRRAS